MQQARNRWLVLSCQRLEEGKFAINTAIYVAGKLFPGGLIVNEYSQVVACIKRIFECLNINIANNSSLGYHYFVVLVWIFITRQPAVENRWITIKCLTTQLGNV